jgi:hypothetical protein
MYYSCFQVPLFQFIIEHLTIVSEVSNELKKLSNYSILIGHQVGTDDIWVMYPYQYWTV